MYSYYRFRHGLGQNLGMNFSQFIQTEQNHYPGPKWHEHVGSWLDRMENGQVHSAVHEAVV